MVDLVGGEQDLVEILKNCEERDTAYNKEINDQKLMKEMLRQSRYWKRKRRKFMKQAEAVVKGDKTKLVTSGDYKDDEEEGNNNRK